jgi:hypothetical protein
MLAVLILALSKKYPLSETLVSLLKWVEGG